MAATYQKQYTKKCRGKRNVKESWPSRFLMIGVGVLVLSLLTFDMIGILGVGDDQSAHLTNVQVSNTASEVAAASTDRETTCLGPPGCWGRFHTSGILALEVSGHIRSDKGR